MGGKESTFGKWPWQVTEIQFSKTSYALMMHLHMYDAINYNLCIHIRKKPGN